MRKLCLILAAAFILTISAQGSELLEEQAKQIGVEELEDALPSEAQDLLEGLSPTDQSDLLQQLTAMLQTSVQKSEGFFRQSLAAMLRILVIVIVCHLASSIGEERAKVAAVLTAVLAITAFCLSDLKVLVGLGRDTMDQMSSFLTILLPVMAGASAASGSSVGAGISYSVTVFFSNLLVGACNRLLIPTVYAYVGLAAADAALQQNRLKRIRELVGWLMNNGLKAIVYLFVGLLTVTGVLSGSADAAALKAAKTAISTFIPVVGGIISGAAETVLSSAALLKQAVGTFGMLAVLAIFLIPFLQMGISYLMLKITSALTGVLGSCLAELLESLSCALGFVLGMVGSCAVIALLSCCCFLKVVQV